MLINQLEKRDQQDPDDALGGPLLAKKRSKNNHTKSTVDNKEKSLRQMPNEYVSKAFFELPGSDSSENFPENLLLAPLHPRSHHPLRARNKLQNQFLIRQ